MQHRTSVVSGCTKYTDSACLQVLNQRNNCLSCNDSYTSIVSSANEKAKEDTARFIRNGLPLLGASRTCTSHLIPFMCFYLFPLCGSNATAVSREQCIQISTGVCKNEWQLALGISTLKDQIPNCERLPPMEGKGLLFMSIMSGYAIKTMLAFICILLPCSEMALPLINTSMQTNMPSASVLVNCSDQFALVNGTCTPLCGKLQLFLYDNSVTDYVIQIMAALVGILCSILLIIISCVQRKTM